LTNGNTEVCAEAPGFGGFQYPNGVNPNGSMYIHPLMLPTTVRQDIKRFYEWGVDGICVQEAYDSGIVGYEFQRALQVAEAVSIRTQRSIRSRPTRRRFTRIISIIR